jgi:hypothetical protein
MSRGSAHRCSCASACRRRSQRAIPRPHGPRCTAVCFAACQRRRGRSLSQHMRAQARVLRARGTRRRSFKAPVVCHAARRTKTAAGRPRGCSGKSSHAWLAHCARVPFKRGAGRFRWPLELRIGSGGFSFGQFHFAATGRGLSGLARCSACRTSLGARSFGSALLRPFLGEPVELVGVVNDDISAGLGKPRAFAEVSPIFKGCFSNTDIFGSRPLA